LDCKHFLAKALADRLAFEITDGWEIDAADKLMEMLWWMGIQYVWQVDGDSMVSVEV
jgi:hypothetical protein